MSLTRSEVENIAHLARLEITPEEIPPLAEKLSRIIEFVDQLRNADTKDVRPMAHPLNMTQRLRADAVTETDQRARFQQDAPRVEDGFYVVPRVME
ncbi:MAG: Asp-tRNA(Asn)/Glu-tRNA(Gln) amidotransferase subunit GatC [Gammaproteobacteria bacterium]|nr:Asp-tRNA(Asn)/Glu-tRNA(Gln) amidotransferase subunit GatC [Gammaproteobacteria bacterium]